MKYPRAIYVIIRLLESLVSVLSRFINAAFLGGSTHQTTSARAHLEAPTNPSWARARWFINNLFFLQANHCEWAWLLEVESAKKTLARAFPKPESV